MNKWCEVPCLKMVMGLPSCIMSKEGIDELICKTVARCNSWKVQRKLLIEFYITFFPCRTLIGGYWWCLPEWCLLMVLPWSTTHWGTCTAPKRQASMHLIASAGILSPLHVQMLQMCLPPQRHQAWLSKPDPKRTPEDQLQTCCSGSH